MTNAAEKPQSIRVIKKMLIVLDDIMEKAEFQGSPETITLKESVGLDGVTSKEYEDIIPGFFAKGILNDKQKPEFDVMGGPDEHGSYDIVGRDGSDFDTTIDYDVLYSWRQKYLDQLAKLEGQGKYETNETKGVSFDSEKGILKIGKYQIIINLKNVPSRAQTVLDFFKNDFHETADYIEIAQHIAHGTGGKMGEEEFKKGDYHLLIYRACQDIQDKVSKQTKSVIEDFLDFNSSKTGSVKINPKYL